MLYGLTNGESPKSYRYIPKSNHSERDGTILESHSTALPTGMEETYTDYWSSAAYFADQSKASINLQQNASSKDHTGIEQASQAFRDKVALRLADGMGAQIIECDKTLLPDVKMLVSQKLSMASNLGQQKNVSGQVRMLLSAFSDVEWFVDTILSNFNGVELPAQAKGLIATLRAMQSSIMAQIKGATGLNLSEDELRALLEKDPTKTGQNINLSWLVQQDHELTPKQPASTESNGSTNPSQTNNNSDETINGIQSNSQKYQKNLKSGGTKIVHELEKIMQQIQSLMGGGHKGTQANAVRIFSLLDRGAAICMVAAECDDLQLGSNEHSTPQFKGALEQLNKNAIATIQMPPAENNVHRLN